MWSSKRKAAGCGAGDDVDGNVGDGACYNGGGASVFVLDTDPGIDDAVALLLMERLVATRMPCVVVTSYGNAPLDVTHRNLLGLRKAMACAAPVVKGCARPLSGTDPFFDFYHGKDALGGVGARLPEAEDVSLPLDALASLLRPNDRVTYCAVGPLTNLATLLQRGDPAALQIDRVLVMGGGLQAFNAPHESEFNFHADPEAVDVVFRSPLDVTLAPFDLGMHAALTADDLAWATRGSRLPLMDAVLAQSLETAYAHGRTRADIHDGFPVLYCRFPEKFKTGRMNLAVDEWGAVRESSDGRPVTVLSGLKEPDLLPRAIRRCLDSAADPSGGADPSHATDVSTGAGPSREADPSRETDPSNDADPSGSANPHATDLR